MLVGYRYNYHIMYIYDSLSFRNYHIKVRI